MAQQSKCARKKLLRSRVNVMTENYVPSISDKIDSLVRHKVCGHTGKVRINGIKGDLEIGFDSAYRQPSAGPAVYIHEE